MGLRIVTNVPVLKAQRALARNQRKLNSTLEKLASGSRINSAGDDAAGLAISEKLKASIRSLGQATRNALDGVSMIQVAEGATNEISNIIIRLRELSIQAASDTIGETERSYVEREVQHLKEEINRIAKVTEYNGMPLLSGEHTSVMEIQVGLNNDPELDRMSFDPEEQNVTLEALQLDDISVATKEDAQANLAKLDEALNILNRNRASLGALQNRLKSTINNLRIYEENLSAAKSRIRDTDMAVETSNLAKSSVLNQSNIAVLAQANSIPKLALNLLS